MADEQYRWLDRETAERLLRGESPDAVDPAARQQAERLAEALGALSATPPPTSEELPGEAAALAAFRKVRAERDEERAALAGPGRARPAGAGLIRIGARAGDRGANGRRARRPRALRLGLAAALAAGTVGGVAFAAGTGALPMPFDDPRPRPGASVPAAAPSGRPLPTPSPDGAHGGAGGSVVPDGGRPSRDVAEDDGRDRGRDPEDGSGPSGGAGRSWTEIAAACRALRDGHGLDADRRRTLAGVAGGSARVGRYCDGVLRTTHPGSGSSGGSSTSGQGQGQGGDGNGGNGNGNGKGHNGNGNGNGGAAGNGSGGAAGKGEGDAGKGNGNGKGNGGGNGHAGGGNGHSGGNGNGNGTGNGNGNEGGSGRGSGKGDGQGRSGAGRPAAAQDAPGREQREVRTAESPEPSFSPA
ncbi:hypothetical protein AB0L04_06640 [Streptomyces glaucescens]|uniref:hypothetical protein n=1 Tax=Streptomyces glaucescens TaxID=1907 RepID=UPI00344B915C